MATDLEEKIIAEFVDFSIKVEPGSVLDRLSDLSREYSLSPGDLLNEWVAFSQKNDECSLESHNLDKFEGSLRTRSRKTPLSRKTVSKTKGGGVKMHTMENLSDIFGGEELINAYATPEDSERIKNQKRGAEQTTPTTPASKMRHTQNGATPTSHPTSNGTTPTNGHTHNGAPTTPYNHTPLGSTPGRYGQRKTSGNVVASLNDCTVPVSWRHERREVVTKQLGESPFRESEHYMFQKVTEKAFALMDRIEELGKEICSHNDLPEPLSLGQHSLEPAVFTGQVVCEGEGHLNARSCLLEGPIGKTRSNKGVCLPMSIPDNVSCSLFPGQIIAVEGINNLHEQLHPSRIYDEGVPPPPPTRQEIKGFTLMAAAGPFTTSDSLDMEPLRDLLGRVKRDKPDVLILMGPFVDSSHQLVKSCQLPGDTTFTDFFLKCVLEPVQRSCAERSKVILIPSQRDIHHPYSVYPQPPLLTPPTPNTHNYSDPSTLAMNGMCVGVTSTDVLFHLSGRVMNRGHTADRMARIAGHILQQRCYYPLLPVFRRDNHGTISQTSTSREPPSSSSNLSDQKPVAMDTDEETTEVNMNIIDAFENRRAVLPVRPDLLILPSDLKPFIKVVHGCICVNPGRLTKRTTGGTFMRAIVPDISVVKTDLTSHVGVEIMHI